MDELMLIPYILSVIFLAIAVWVGEGVFILASLFFLIIGVVVWRLNSNDGSGYP